MSVPRKKMSTAAKIAVCEHLLEEGKIATADEYIELLNADIWYLDTETILKEEDAKDKK